MRMRMLRFCALLLAALLLSAPALGETVSEGLMNPPKGLDVFTVQVGDQELMYTWADIARMNDRFAGVRRPYNIFAGGQELLSAWVGVLLSDLAGDIEAELDMTLIDGDEVRAYAADGTELRFTIGEARAEEGNYMLGVEPQKSYDRETQEAYPDSYVHLLRGDRETPATDSGLPHAMGMEITLVPRPEAGAEVASPYKLPDATEEQMLASVLTVAVYPHSGGNPLVYYFSLDELRARYGRAGETFNYDRHAADTAVYYNGAPLLDILADLADVSGALLSSSDKLSDGMFVQILEADALHAQVDGTGDADLDSYIDSLSYARGATHPLVIWELWEGDAEEDGLALEDDEEDGLALEDDEEDGLALEDDEEDGLALEEDEEDGLALEDDEEDGLTLEDDEGAGDAAFLFVDSPLWAASMPGYLTVYRNTADARTARCDLVLGVVVSLDGEAFNADTAGAFTVRALDAADGETELLPPQRVTGVLRGVTYAVQAPLVPGMQPQGAVRVLVTVTEDEAVVDFLYEAMKRPSIDASRTERSGLCRSVLLCPVVIRRATVALTGARRHGTLSLNVW